MEKRLSFSATICFEVMVKTFIVSRTSLATSVAALANFLAAKESPSKKLFPITLAPRHPIHEQGW